MRVHTGWRLIAFGTLSMLMALPRTGAQQASDGTSQLWGKSGELWSPESRLPDFSFAGYRSGQNPLPNPPVKFSVRDFGAKGDGETDDTAAFKQALEKVENGAVLVPAGRYRITDILTIRKSNIVLRGEGPEKSVLFFPKPLNEVKPQSTKNTAGEGTTIYSWSGGLIWVDGTPQPKPKKPEPNLGTVAVKAARGSNILELTAPAAIEPGQRVEIVQTDPGDKSFVNHLYGGQPGEAKNLGWARTPFVSRVLKVEGTKLTLERPLRTDADPQWKAVVRCYQPLVTEVGIEHLGFEFPVTPYEGHFKEAGFNALTFDEVADCWARNLRIVNSDSGVYLSGNFITAEKIMLESSRTPDASGQTGHHGVTLGTDNLFQDFDFRTKFVHDISVEATAGSVAARGKGVDLCFDHHKRHPHANLFTDIDLGLGTRMFRSGGGGGLGRNTGAWATFWNIRSARPQNWPWSTATTGFGPDLMNLVGVESKAPQVIEPAGRWLEQIPPGQLQPQNLYEAQLARRVKGGK